MGWRFYWTCRQVCDGQAPDPYQKGQWRAVKRDCACSTGKNTRPGPYRQNRQGRGPGYDRQGGNPETCDEGLVVERDDAGRSYKEDDRESGQEQTHRYRATMHDARRRQVPHPSVEAACQTRREHLEGQDEDGDTDESAARRWAGREQ